MGRAAGSGGPANDRRVQHLRMRRSALEHAFGRLSRDEAAHLSSLAGERIGATVHASLRLLQELVPEARAVARVGRAHLKLQLYHWRTSAGT